MIRHLRFHGRGGEGVKLASRIVSRAGFLAGLFAQDSPLYGAERRGAPVVACTRLGTTPITARGYVDCPDVAVVMDATLLGNPEAAVLDGIDNTTIVLANSASTPEVLSARHRIPGIVATLDVTSLVLDMLGRHLLSAPVAGFAVNATGLVPWEILAGAVRAELSDLEIPPERIARNLSVTRRAFDLAPRVPDVERRTPPTPRADAFRVPRLPARIAAPSVSREGTSALRHTGEWRVYRPSIELASCTRCFICFALCPEGAIGLDEAQYPVIDYDHCKGCLVCATECPTEAIAYAREEAP